VKIFNEHTNKHIVVERMEPYFNSKGHFILDSPKGCDVQLSIIRIEKNNNLPIVLRIDGIYYDLDTDYKKRNLAISTSNSIADAVIYQSNYSERICERFLNSRKRGAISKVIYNGVDSDWCGERKKHEGINIIVISKWRRLKRLKEIIDLFLDFLKIVPDSTLHILGKLHDNKPVKHNKIIYYGMVSREVVGSILNIADFSIHLCKRDSCPNSVVETIAAGVPVITTNKCGGTTEICSITEGCMVCNGDFDNDFKPDYPYRDSYNILTPELYNNILQSMVMISRDKRLVKLPEQLTAKYMTDSYIDVMEMVKK
jgi:glycosyltransferase involved in cell wall biosynthesis